MKNKRMKPTERKLEILDAALLVAERGNYASITRDAIAKQAGVSSTLVQHYFGSMTKLKRAVMRRAVKCGNLTVIAQGLIAKDEHAMNAPHALRDRAFRAAFDSLPVLPS